MGNLKIGVLGIEAVAAEGGDLLDAGAHIDSSQSMETIWNNPNGVDGVDAVYGSYGTYSVALPGNNWDFVTLQPHISHGSTQGLDRTHISNFINLTKSNPSYDGTNFFVLQTWPRESQWPYSDFWLSDSIDDPTTATFMKRQYFDNLMPLVKSDNPGTSVWMIPTGEVLYELEQQFLAGTLPDVTSHMDFFRPAGSIHLSYSIGRYVAATTAYATMMRKDVRGQQAPASFFSGTPTLTPALLETINETIWDVLIRNSWSGLTDYNNDSIIDSLDLTTWEAAYGISDVADSNGDGYSAGDDFLRWQQSYVDPPAPSADFDNSGLIEGADLNIWEASFGVNGGADADVDYIDPMVNQQGCGFLYAKLEDCLADNDRDWRKCGSALKSFKDCYDAFNVKNNTQKR